MTWQKSSGYFLYSHPERGKWIQGSEHIQMRMEWCYNHSTHSVLFQMHPPHWKHSKGKDRTKAKLDAIKIEIRLFMWARIVFPSDTFLVYFERLRKSHLRVSVAKNGPHIQIVYLLYIGIIIESKSISICLRPYDLISFSCAYNFILPVTNYWPHFSIETDF